MSEPSRGEQRSVARLGAVQALYQVEMTDAEPAAVIQEFIDHRLAEEQDGLLLSAADRELFGALVVGVTDECTDLDDMLTAVLAEGWPVERLESILRAILRCGAYEIGYRIDIPPRVSIAEYVKLAESFFTGKEPGMANAVLDRLAQSLRPDELAEGSPPPSAEPG